MRLRLIAICAAADRPLHRGVSLVLLHLLAHFVARHAQLLHDPAPLHDVVDAADREPADRDVAEHRERGRRALIAASDLRASRSCVLRERGDRVGDRRPRDREQHRDLRDRLAELPPHLHAERALDALEHVEPAEVGLQLLRRRLASPTWPRLDDDADHHHPDEHRRDDADRLHTRRRSANCIAAAWSGCAITMPMSWSTPRHRGARRACTVIWSSTIAASIAGPRREVGRLRDLALLARLLDALVEWVSRSSATAVGGHRSGSASASVTERRDRVAHEVAERGRDQRERERDDDRARSIDAQREREREHVEVRRGARRADRA